MEKIVTIVHHKQCKEFHDAIKRRDGAAAHLLYIEPWRKPYWMIEAEMRRNQLHADYKAEMERIENLPPELIEIELKLKLQL